MGAAMTVSSNRNSLVAFTGSDEFCDAPEVFVYLFHLVTIVIVLDVPDVYLGLYYFTFVFMYIPIK